MQLTNYNIRRHDTIDQSADVDEPYISKHFSHGAAYIHSFRHNNGVCRTGGQTDRQTEGQTDTNAVATRQRSA